MDAKDAAGVRAVLAGAGATGPRRGSARAPQRAWPGTAPSLDGSGAGPRVLSGGRGARSASCATVADALAAAGLGDRVAIDLGEVRGLDYYTGLVFRVYARGLGFEVGGGGRYDTLLARFGRPMPAVGFMLGLDRVALLLERQGARPAEAGAPAEPIEGPGLGAALSRRARRRAAGARVRFGSAGQAR